MKTRSDIALEFATRLLIIFGCSLLISCGGGIAGSGNGGGESNPDLPPGEEKYNIEFLPLQLSPALPASVSRDTEETDWFDNRAPAQTLTHGIASLIDNKSALGLMQLYIDSGWEDILEYCDAQQAATQCSLQNSGLSITYTDAMALWEIDLRKEIEHEKLGLSSNLPAQAIQAIEQQVIAKVGSQIQLDSVVFEKLEGGEFDYLVTMEINELTPLSCMLSWDTTRQIVETSVRTESGASTESLYETSYNQLSGKAEFEQMLSEAASERATALQLQLDKIPDTDEFYLESTLTQTTRPEEKQIKSRGQINDLEAYLFSESTVKGLDSESTVLHREVFGAEPIAAATCDPLASTSNCNVETDWMTVLGNNPTSTELYLSNEQLDQFTTVRNNITLGGVSADLSTFLLLDSDKVTPDLQNSVLRVSIPALGNLDWPMVQQGDGRYAVILADIQVAILIDLEICRTERSATDTGGTLTAACGDVPLEKLRNAVVAGESFSTDGVLTLILETSAVVNPLE